MGIAVKNSKWKFDWRKYGVSIALVALIIFFALMSDKFLTQNNIINILRQVSVVGICAVGMAFVIVSGSVDVGIGSALGLAAVAGARFMLAGLPTWLAVCLVIADGCLVGIVNGILICDIGMHPMIGTMGMQIFLRGIIYLITQGMPIYGIHKNILFMGQGYVGIIPVPVIIMAAVFGVGFFILNKSVFGRLLYGVGGNAEASRLSGVKVRLIKYQAFIISGVLTAIAGLILLARVNSGQPNAGERYEADIIPACVLGGVSLSGGEGNIGGVLVGVLIMGVLSNGMILMNVNEYWQWTIKGLVLLFAVAFDRLSQKSREKVTVTAKGAEDEKK